MSEKRLIDANAFKRQAHIETVRQGLNVEKILLFCELIDMQPTIDAVEVVRCGNCWNGRVDRVNHGYGAPYRVDCRTLNRMMYDHDFCSLGKRKELDHERPD